MDSKISIKKNLEYRIQNRIIIDVSTMASTFQAPKIPHEQRKEDLSPSISHPQCYQNNEEVHVVFDSHNEHPEPYDSQDSQCEAYQIQP